jgi:hypothetical protein
MSNREARPSTESVEEMQMVPVFTTPNFAEAEVITDLLEMEDIAYIAQPAAPPQFLISAGDPNQTRILVGTSQAPIARELIQQAIVDEALPGDGNFL